MVTFKFSLRSSPWIKLQNHKNKDRLCLLTITTISAPVTRARSTRPTPLAVDGQHDHEGSQAPTNVQDHDHDNLADGNHDGDGSQSAILNDHQPDPNPSNSGSDNGSHHGDEHNSQRGRDDKGGSSTRTCLVPSQLGAFTPPGLNHRHITAPGPPGGPGGDPDDEPNDDGDDDAALGKAIKRLLAREEQVREPRDCHANNKGIKINPPEKFSGAKRAEFPTFILANHLYFRAKSFKGAYTDAEKVTFAGSYLTGAARKWFNCYLNKDEESDVLSDWKTFVRELKKRFGKLNPEADAIRKISNLRMKDSDHIHKVLITFQECQNQITWEDGPASALSTMFCNLLAPCLKQMFLQQQASPTDGPV